MVNKNISPDGKYKMKYSPVKIEKVHGFEFHQDLEKSTAQIYTQLDYRHWDTWNDGTYNHVFLVQQQSPILLTEISCQMKPLIAHKNHLAEMKILSGALTANIFCMSAKTKRNCSSSEYKY